MSNETPTWAEMLTAKLSAKAGMLAVYDQAIAGGYDDEEARAMVKGIVFQGPLNMWPLFELWLDRERPTKVKS